MTGWRHVGRWLVVLVLICAGGVVAACLVNVGFGIGFAATAGGTAGKAGWWL